MVYAATTTKYVFAMQPGDVFWCTADCGWITGHSYLTYGRCQGVPPGTARMPPLKPPPKPPPMQKLGA
jgi:acyl-coenzyme A synthetase/AMP-(fatty) acid ligase